MAFEVTLPRLGWDMEDGALTAWLKEDGEYVQEGDLLFSVEGDKAVQEIEALDSGYLAILPDGPLPGQKVPVGTLLAYLVSEEERSTFRFQTRASEEVSEQEAEIVMEAAPTAAQAQEIPLPANDRSKRVYISPYARRLAEGLGVDWHLLKGSGRDGRIMAKDVEQFAAQREWAAPQATMTPSAPASQPPARQDGKAVRIPVTSMRRKIADHMAYSAHTAAPVTLTAEVDATDLVALRKALKEDAVLSGKVVPSYNDLLAKLSAQALLEHPLVNARLEDNEVVQSSSVNVAIAVDTERGLVVPVLRNVQDKSLSQVARESSALIERTRSGAVTYEEMQDATFTITNLGMYEIDAFTPIIDLPQCAILGVGRIAPKQVVLDADTKSLAIRQMVILSLTFDHRLIDGAQAARFLQRIKRFVERPYLWLAG